MKTAVGQHVGNLVLRRKIAEGGMGSVWVAWHRGLERELAVKFLTQSQDDDPEAAQRFSREAQIAKRIRNPHVPEVFEHGESEDGTPYLAMALLQGVDLSTWMSTHRTFTVGDVARLVDHVGAALSAAHEIGVVHRDVKPSNIIVRDDIGGFHAYLIDFGIAKSTHPRKSQMVTHPGTTVGTPSYMSPEQLMGKGVDERSDMWSLGVVAYRCLTGALPFTGDTFRELCLSIYCGDFLPVSVRIAGVPRSLDAWFKRALDSEPDGRFSSVSAMCEAFHRAVSAAPSANLAPDPFPSARASLPATLVTVATKDLAPRRSLRGGRGLAAFAAGGALIGASTAFFIATAGPIGRLPLAHAAHPATVAPAPRVLDGGVEAAARHSL